MPTGTRLYERAPAAENGEAPGVRAGTSIHMRYAVPDAPNSEVPEWNTSGAPRLGADDVPSTPDPIRTAERKPPPNDPNDRGYRAQQTADFHARHSVEHTTESWNVQQHRVPPGQNPLWEQEREHTRPSAVRSPLGYMFTRPWHIPRNVKDALGEDAIDHISMADHRRAYEIFGMRTQDKTGVNTFRFDPRPWDTNLYPPENTITPEAAARGGAVSGNRSYRL